MKWAELFTHLSGKRRRSRGQSRVQVVDMVRPRRNYKTDRARANKTALNSPRITTHQVELRDPIICRVKSSLDT